MSLATGTPIGKYVVRRKLAEGGMAEIFLCSSLGPEGFEKDVVIKRVRAFLAGDPLFVKMFVAEAQLVSRLTHANVVQIFDFGKHEDTYYLAMEYVHGRSLWEARKRSRERMTPMPPTLVAQIGMEVARGLHYAHRATDKGRTLGLVHRDVTPHNVLLSFEGEVKLTDFGIAKGGNGLTAPGVLKGKFAYMSPEQARGEEVDARTDVFALGIVLWEMLTGGRLFAGDSDVAVLKAVQHSAIAPPARLNPDVHPELDAVVMRALQRDRDKRFQTAHELERALGQFILQNAESIEETDLGAFLRRLYADDEPVSEKAVAAPPFRPPTARMRSPSKEAPPPPPPPAAPAMTAPTVEPVSPDEDVHAETWPVDRENSQRPTLKSEPVAGPVPVVLADPRARRRDRPTGARRKLRAGVLLGALTAIVSAVGAVSWKARPPAQPVVEASRPEPRVAEVHAEPEPPTPQPAPAAPIAERVDPNVAAEAPSGEEEGTLVLSVVPWAEVTVDGKPLGEVTGKRELKLPPGRHSIRFHHNKLSDRKSVVVKPGGRHEVAFNLMPR